MKVIETHNTATTAYFTDCMQENKADLPVARKNVKKALIAARNKKWLEVKINEIEDLNQDPRSTWKAIKEINTASQVTTSKLQL
jgi:hypothetical protein